MNDNSNRGNKVSGIQVMTEIQLGEDVRSVRRKIGMEANDYLSLWRSINTKAQEICQRIFGVVSLKQAITLSAINELKDYYVNNQELKDQDIRQKILDALAVNGFAAWVINNAIKRNNNKNRKAQGILLPTPTPQTPGEASRAGNVKESAAGKEVFDPIRNV